MAAISNNSGQGGASLYRHPVGETIRDLNARFPHWFCRRFHAYDGREAEVPVDSHLLISLIALRPVLVASAADDQWAGPEGERLGARGADPVYRLVHAPPGPVHHTRPGARWVTAADWETFLDLGDEHLRRRAP